MVAVLLLTLSVHGLYANYIGPKFSPDSYALYDSGADVLIDHNFNWSAYAENNRQQFQGHSLLNYIGFCYVVAFFKSIFGEFWAAAVVFFHICLSILVAQLIFIVLRNVGLHNLICLASVLLFVGCFEWLLWEPFILGDISFASLCFLIFFLLATDKIKNGWLVFGGRITCVVFLCIAAYFYRPTALPILLLAMLFCVLSFMRNLQKRIYWVRRVFYGIISLIVVGVLAHSMFMYDLNTKDGQYALPIIEPLLQNDSFKGYLESFSKDVYLHGKVIHDRPETFHAPPASFFDYLTLSLDKLRYFFIFSIDAFSLRHKIVNFVFFVPVYFFSSWATFHILRKNNRLSLKLQWVGWLAVVFVLLVATFHALTIIDYDWRYRLPCIPPLAVLSGIGMYCFVEDGLKFMGS